MSERTDLCSGDSRRENLEAPSSLFLAADNVPGDKDAPVRMHGKLGMTESGKGWQV